MKIVKLTLKNFQGYEDEVFEFDSGFNCFVGESSVGKSAVVRALQLLFFNVWSDVFVRMKSGTAYVKAEFDNNIIIEREKGLGVNRLIVTRDGTAKLFENFGFDYPPEVLEVMQVSPVVIDGRKFPINIADQDETYFLLKESGIIKSKLLSRLANLDVIDRALAEANRIKRSQSSQRLQLEKEIMDLNFRLEKYSDLDETIEKFKNSEVLLKAVEIKHSLLCVLHEYKSRLILFSREEASLRQKLSFLQEVNVNILLQRINELLELKRMSSDLNSLKDNESYLLSELTRVGNDLEKCKGELLALGKCPLCLSTLNEEQVQKLVDTV